MFLASGRSRGLRSLVLANLSFLGTPAGEIVRLLLKLACQFSVKVLLTSFHHCLCKIASTKEIFAV